MQETKLRPIDEFLFAALEKAGIKVCASKPIQRGNSLAPDDEKYLLASQEAAAIFSDGYGPLPRQEYQWIDEKNDEDDSQESSGEKSGDPINAPRKLYNEGDYRYRIRLGDAPMPYDEVEAYHPDRPDEPVIWWTNPLAFGWGMHGYVFCTRRLVIKESFAFDCADGRLKRRGNPANTLVRMFKDIFFLKPRIVI
ncbi:MAG: hypothetical protein LBC63_05815 [Holophagales bacterium]|nr:hypothetical protein [Holophagales bacterium]